MTKEIMTLTQCIAESKRLQKAITSAITDEDFTLIDYYFDYAKFVGARTIEQREELIKSRIDSISSLMRRLDAINKARIKANSETMVEVVEFLPLKDILNGKTPSTEKITIADAINRKLMYRTVFLYLAKQLESIFAKDIAKKEQYESKAIYAVQESMNRLFPANSDKVFKQKDKEEAEARERKINEVKILDPLNVLSSDSIATYKNMVVEYINSIDTQLSTVNASTQVEVEY